MPALPIVERELRVAARKGETYWSRCGVVLGLGLLWIPGWLGTFGTSTELNTFIFDGMLWAGFGVSCVACLFTADAISRERRDGTLGLLFLSRVRVADVLLGKLGSSGFKGLCMLAAFLPMLMIPVLAGGVTGGEAAREGLVLLNTFWFSLCVGLWASGRSSEAYKTIYTACWVVGGIVLTPFLCSFSWRNVLPIGAAPYAYVPLSRIDLLSPIMTLAYGRDSFYKTSPLPFWISLGLVQGLAWLFFLLTSIRLRRSLREPSEDVSSIAAKRRIKKRKRLFNADSNPIDWLVRHERGIRTTLWIAVLIEVLYFVWSWAMFRGMFNLGSSTVLYWVIWFAASTSTDALFARAGSKFFYDSKRSGHLEMLVTTPLGPNGVIQGQWSALKKMLAWPVAISVGAMLLDEDVSLVTEIGQPGALHLGWVMQCFVTWGIDIAGSILGVLAVCWFGMLFALKGKSAAGIILRAAGLGTAVPALFKTLYELGAERITFMPASGLWPGTMSNWLEETIVMLYYLWLFRLARKWVLRELSGAAPVRKKLSRQHSPRVKSRPRVTHATDVTASAP